MAVKIVVLLGTTEVEVSSLAEVKTLLVPHVLANREASVRIEADGAEIVRLQIAKGSRTALFSLFKLF